MTATKAPTIMARNRALNHHSKGVSGARELGPRIESSPSAGSPLVAQASSLVRGVAQAGTLVLRLILAASASAGRRADVGASAARSDRLVPCSSGPGGSRP